MKAKRVRTNLSVAATAKVLEEIDRLIAASGLDLSRSAVALAAIQEGLPRIAKKIDRLGKGT